MRIGGFRTSEVAYFAFRAVNNGGMGIVYAAELRPSKMELLAEWLPRQEWFDGGDSPLVRLGSFRFDDPAGVVGTETILVGAGTAVYQVPLTYRGAPLENAEAFLVGTMKHSVLGDRWVYDATGDPVYQGELAAALFAGKAAAVEYRDVDGKIEALPATAELFSSGTGGADVPTTDNAVTATADGVTTIATGGLRINVLRVLDSAAIAGEGLSVTWAGQDEPVQIATF